MNESMTLQGRKLIAEDIELIRRLMADNPDWHRARISTELCRMWNWRTDKGQLKDIACCTMLRKLEQRQLIVLPPPLRPGNHARRIRDIPHSRDPIEGALDDLRPIEIIMVTGRCDDDHLFHCLMDRYHYLGCRGHVGEHMKYMVYDCTRRPLACLLFGSAAWKTAPRDSYVGWNTATRQKNLKLLTNNTRFLILPWVRVPNLASFILGACLKGQESARSNEWQQLAYGAIIIWFRSANHGMRPVTCKRCGLRNTANHLKEGRLRIWRTRSRAMGSSGWDWRNCSATSSASSRRSVSR